MRVFVQFAGALVALALFASGGAQAQRNGEAGQFDYYALVLNWSPSYCANEGRHRRGEPQCRGDRPYHFILHGLWPQYERGWPQNCPTAQRPWVPEELITKMLDIMPSKRLIIHEYRKHGTCSGLTPEEYFRVSRQLFDQIKIPERFQNPQDYVTLSPGDVEKAFLEANPQIEPEMISVACKGRNLGDLRICFGRDLKLRDCGVNENQQKLCSSERIVMPPVRVGAYRSGEAERGGNRERNRQDEEEDEDEENGGGEED